MSPRHTTCLMIGSPPVVARSLGETLGAIPDASLTHTARLSDGLAVLARHAFDVIFLDSPLVDAAPHDALSRVAAAAQGAGIVVLVRPVDEPDGRASLSAGARAYLVKEPNWERDSSRIRSALSAASAADREPHGGSIASVIGASGGVGTTTTALRLARQVARGSSTVLAEFRTWPGGLARLADAAPAGHLGACLTAAPPHLASVLTPAGARLKLLFAPRSEVADRELTVERTTRIMAELAQVAERVILELPCESSPSIAAACRSSATIVLVTGTAPAALRQGRAIVELLDAWAIPIDRVCAIAIHRALDRIADPRAMGEVLGCPVLAVLPDDPADDGQLMAPIVRRMGQSPAAAATPP